MDKTLILETLNKSTGSTKLDDQILFMELLNNVIVSPVTISILYSLKELRGIKKNNIIKNKI